MIGNQLAHYRITAKLGQGGMGVVYRARDTRLGRDVALKLLPDDLAADPDRLARFRAEARAVASLNHPNIVTLYSVEEAPAEEGSEPKVHFLTMELVEGRTLDELIPDDGFALRELLDLAVPIAEALASAHERLVVHRDLKPGNVMVTAERNAVKVLDFGLAKLAAPEAGSADEATTEALLTRAGAAVGTPHYMSPEQARAHRVDHRSDIFSFGVLLYEMATRARPFDGDNPVEVLSSLLRDPAPRLDPPAGAMHPEFARIVARCLEKEPADRFQTAREVHRALTALRDRMSATKPEATDGERKSIAVLPFTNMSPDPEQEYFCDGMAEEIINTLGAIEELRIAPRISSFRYKHADSDSRTVGEQLGVSHLLEGSVRKAADRLRITVQLIDVAADSHVWTERYDRRLEDVFAIQEDIAQSTAAALQVALTSHESRALRRAPTTHAAAYDFYLRGRAFFYRGSQRDHASAKEMFSRAIEIDPSFTRAYAGLADTLSYTYKHFDYDPALLDEADAASAKALELAPDLPEAHTSRGVVHWLHGRHEAADREFEAAIRLDPRLFDAYYLYGVACFVRGLHERAARLFRQASEVGPEDYQCLVNLGALYRGMGRHEEARAAFSQGLSVATRHLELNPDDVRARYMGANALVALGETEKGLAWAEKAAAIEPDNPLVFENLAGIYAAAGLVDRGLDCIERAFELGMAHKETFENDPDLAPLRESPRFAALLERF